MTLSLIDPITATQSTFDVAGSDVLNPGDLKTIDSEYVLIRTAVPATGAPTRQRVSAYRGAVGSSEAAHSAGATLTTTSFSGGGEQTVRRLGPAAITFEELSVTPVETGFVIPAGAVVVKAWAVLAVNGDTPEGAILSIEICASDDLDDRKLLVRYDTFDGYIAPASFVLREQGVKNSSDASQVFGFAFKSAVALEECTLVVTGTGPLEDGVFNIYALIAESA